MATKGKIGQHAFFKSAHVLQQDLLHLYRIHRFATVGGEQLTHHGQRYSSGQKDIVNLRDGFPPQQLLLAMVLKKKFADFVSECVRRFADDTEYFCVESFIFTEIQASEVLHQLGTPETATLHENKGLRVSPTATILRVNTRIHHQSHISEQFQLVGLLRVVV